jgi:DNA-binding Xre family transcriptional regulator
MTERSSVRREYFWSLPNMGRFYDKALVDKIIIKIKKLREQREITLQEFYNDTGIHLARIESEKRDLPISTLKRICDYFEISLSDFLKGL